MEWFSRALQWLRNWTEALGILRWANQPLALSQAVTNTDPLEGFLRAQKDFRGLSHLATETQGKDLCWVYSALKPLSEPGESCKYDSSIQYQHPHAIIKWDLPIQNRIQLRDCAIHTVLKWGVQFSAIKRERKIVFLRLSRNESHGLWTQNIISGCRLTIASRSSILKRWQFCKTRRVEYSRG